MKQTAIQLSHRARLALFSLSALFFQGSLAAEEDYLSMSLGELLNVPVSTPSRRLEPIDSAPNVMYVIDQQQIRNRGYQNLKDLLTHIPGFGVFLGREEYISQVRGIAPNAHNKVTFMVNGQRINSLTETQFFNGPINLRQFERVEVIVGPGSVLYGVETLLATVNLITGPAPTNELLVAVGQDSGQGGSFGDYKTVTLNGGMQSETGDYANFSASYYEQNGWGAWDDDNFPNMAGLSFAGKTYPSYFITADAKLEDWAFQFVSLNSDKHFPVGVNMSNLDRHRFDYVDDFYIARDKPINDNYSMQVNFGYSDKRFARQVTSGSGGEYDLAQKSYRGELRLNYKTEKMLVQTGIQGQTKQNRHNYALNWNPDDPSNAGGLRSLVRIDNTETLGAYVSIDYFVSRQLKLVAALRGDTDTILDNDKTYFNPRLALVYTPSDSWTSKVMYNKATHMPDPWMSPLNQLWGEGNPFAPAWAQTNPMVERPETYSSIEWQNIFYPSSVDNLRLMVNLYYHQLHDFISSFNPFTNVGDFDGYGLDYSIDYRLNERVSLWTNGAFSWNDFELSAEQFTRSLSPVPSNDEGDMLAAPRFTANLGGSYQLSRDVNLDASLHYFTRQPARDLVRNEYVDVNDQVYVDLSASWMRVKSSDLTARLSIKNLTDNRDHIGAQWREMMYQPRGRSVVLSLEYKL